MSRCAYPRRTVPQNFAVGDGFQVDLYNVFSEDAGTPDLEKRAA